MFNGVLTMNCQEIALMSDEEHSFTCVLSSTNVARYDEWKDTHLIQIATVFLDAVVSDMLIKAKQEPGFERIIAFTEKSRALGLGVLGEATYYQQKSWVFGDLNSIMFNQQLLREMDRESLTASRLLAKELGEPEWLVGYGIRNSHRLALPPTKSTAVIMGGVSDGIMPVFANVYEQDTAGGLVYRINPVLLPIMKGRGQYNEVVMARIAQAQGSVQGEDWLSPHEKDVFKTAFELNQETVLLMASHRQKIMNDGGGGQGQSINLYFPMEATEEEISRIHNIAFEDEYIQGLYYVHSLNEPSTYKVDRSVCASCEG
jgi:ribonucleoside-diphosphate reductase alpha chain